MLFRDPPADEEIAALHARIHLQGTVVDDSIIGPGWSQPFAQAEREVFPGEEPSAYWTSGELGEVEAAIGAGGSPSKPRTGRSTSTTSNGALPARLITSPSMTPR